MWNHLPIHITDALACPVLQLGLFIYERISLVRAASPRWVGHWLTTWQLGAMRLQVVVRRRWLTGALNVAEHCYNDWSTDSHQKGIIDVGISTDSCNYFAVVSLIMREMTCKENFMIVHRTSMLQSICETLGNQKVAHVTSFRRSKCCPTLANKWHKSSHSINPSVLNFSYGRLRWLRISFWSHGKKKETKKRPKYLL